MLYVHVLYVHVLRACGAYLFWSIKITTLGIDVNQLSLIMSSKFACVGRAVTECVTVCVAECVVGTFGRLLRGILKNGILGETGNTKTWPQCTRPPPLPRSRCVCLYILSLTVMSRISPPIVLPLSVMSRVSHCLISR